MDAHIHMNVTASGMGSLFYNDLDIRNEVCGIDMKARVGKLTEVMLYLAKPSVLAEAKARVIIDDKTAAVLLALGWTPPSPEPVPARDKDSADAAR